MTSGAIPSYHAFARWYDAIYDAQGKDYTAEASAVIAVADELADEPASLLDVACGTGRHLAVFARRFDEVAGVDASADMLAVAAERLGPQVPLTVGDLRAFDLGRTFDVVTCLFSAIGHMRDGSELDAAVGSLARHVAPGGVLLIEPWLTPELVRPEGVRDVLTAQTPDGVVARVGSSRPDGDALVLRFAWAVGTVDGVATAEERVRMRLFPRERYLVAVERAGLAASWHDEVAGLAAGRGLLVGQRAVPGPEDAG